MFLKLTSDSDVEDEERTNIAIRICAKKALGMRKVLGELKFPILDQFLEANSEHIYEGRDFIVS
jgi:hypothetical protein